MKKILIVTACLLFLSCATHQTKREALLQKKKECNRAANLLKRAKMGSDEHTGRLEAYPLSCTASGYPLVQGRPVWEEDPDLEGYLGNAAGRAKPPNSHYTGAKLQHLDTTRESLRPKIKRLRKEACENRDEPAKPEDNEMIKRYRAQIDCDATDMVETLVNNIVLKDDWIDPKTGDIHMWAVVSEETFCERANRALNDSHDDFADDYHYDDDYDDDYYEKYRDYSSICTKGKYSIKDGYPLWFSRPNLGERMGIVIRGRDRIKAGDQAQKHLARTIATGKLLTEIDLLIENTCEKKGGITKRLKREIAKNYQSRINCDHAHIPAGLIHDIIIKDDWRDLKTGILYVWVVVKKP